MVMCATTERTKLPTVPPHMLPPIHGCNDKKGNEGKCTIRWERFCAYDHIDNNQFFECNEYGDKILTSCPSDLYLDPDWLECMK